MVQRRKSNTSRNNLLIDLTIGLIFLITLVPAFSGIAIHEWLSIAFGAAIVTHLLLHWQWIVATTRRLFTKRPWNTRINYLLNWALFVVITLVIFSGLMISESVLPLLGLPERHNFAWRRIHDLTANLSLLLIGLHLGMHWRWVVNTFTHYVVRPVLRRPKSAGHAPQTAITPATGDQH